LHVGPPEKPIDGGEGGPRDGRDGGGRHVELVEDVAAPEDEKIGVFSYYAVDKTGKLEVGELGVGFIGRDYVGDVFGAKSLRQTQSTKFRAIVYGSDTLISLP
jgi:hypothetical protein